MVSTTPWISSSGLRLARTRSMVRISWVRPSRAKNSHCSGTSTASAAVMALTVRQVQRRRAVDQHVGVGPPSAGPERVAQPDTSAAACRASSISTPERSGSAGTRSRPGTVDGTTASLTGLSPISTSYSVTGALGARDAQARGGVALRVGVDQQHLSPDRRQGGAQVDGGGGLADAALLVGDRQVTWSAWIYDTR